MSDYVQWEEFAHLLHEQSGLNRRIVETTPKGTADSPSVILEINAQMSHQLPQAIMRERHVISANLGTKPMGHDTLIPCNDVAGQEKGLETEPLIDSIKQVRLATVLLCYQTQIMSDTAIHEYIISAALLLPPGGKLYFIEEAHINTRYLVLQALFNVQKAMKHELRVQRYMILPALTQKFALRIAENSGRIQCSEIADVLATQTGDAEVKMLQVDDPLHSPIRREKILRIGNRVGIILYCDDVIIFEKLTKDQRHLLREKNKKERRKR